MAKKVSFAFFISLVVFFGSTFLSREGQHPPVSAAAVIPTPSQATGNPQPMMTGSQMNTQQPMPVRRTRTS